MSDFDITPVAAGLARPELAAGAAEPDTSSAFADRFVELVRDADARQREAEARIRERAAGEGDLVETMVALSKADVALRFVVQLRNRALEAYQEIMRLPV